MEGFVASILYLLLWIVYSFHGKKSEASNFIQLLV